MNNIVFEEMNMKIASVLFLFLVVYFSEATRLTKRRIKIEINENNNKKNVSDIVQSNEGNLSTEETANTQVKSRKVRQSEQPDEERTYRELEEKWEDVRRSISDAYGTLVDIMILFKENTGYEY
ncbi:uncharacterized protein LOC111617112 [Centruroides sculpturatus]|uniref:uncharacterized protein LOC111615818 n=1 Tax=Centruroides sculpturatus TaxID=218467 RepID=UPI000C6ED57F|nr:uncharacterized protein LOC111615818 [Centruroides sculpturatus]XP_023214214.1 uncharacterized protein LOC111617112 [Centruroides sculpturatus]